MPCFSLTHGQNDALGVGHLAAPATYASTRLRIGTPVADERHGRSPACSAPLLAWRRGAGALVALAASTIAFALAFAVIGIACDFRYLYVVPVVATLCAFAVAVHRRPS